MSTALGIGAALVALLGVVWIAVRGARARGVAEAERAGEAVDRERTNEAAEIAARPPSIGMALVERARARRERRLRGAGMSGDPAAPGDD